MEDLDKDEDPSTPFWVQSTTNTRRTDRLRHRISSFFLSSGLVVFILLVTAVFFLLFILPTTLSFTSQIFRPNSVKKSWDSLNIVLVLVAVVFGFLSRIKNEDYYDSQSTPTNKQNEPLKPKAPALSAQSDQWFSYSNTTAEVLKPNAVAAAIDDTGTSFRNWYNQDDSSLKRNSSSYPDLREFSSSRWDFGGYPRGFYDDLNRDIADPVRINHRRHRSVEEVDILRAVPVPRADKATLVANRSNDEEKVISTPPEENLQPGNLRHRRHRSVEEVDILRAAKGTTPLVANLSNEQGKATTANLHHRRHRSVEEINTLSSIPKSSNRTMFVDTLVVNQNQNQNQSRASYPPPTPPPENRSQDRPVRRKGRKNKKSLEEPPPPPPGQLESEQTEVTIDEEQIQEDNAATKEEEGQQSSSIKRTGSATKDFLNSLYHKKKKKKNPRHKSLDNIDSLLHQSQDPLTIHLQPPPTSTVFQNLFLSKKQKRKRTISVTLTPPSPPPPPPPPPPMRTAAMLPNNGVKQRKMKMLEESANSGGESPLSRIPQPPPPPPPAFLKSPAWKFVVQGDYVRVDSSSGSSEVNDVDSDVTPSAEEGGGATPFQAASPLYCPSPDVNSKAETFITSFRAKLKLEKIHSMNGRQLGLSGLGPGLGPSRN